MPDFLGIHHLGVIIIWALMITLLILFEKKIA
jgi:hypothetical protein